MVSQLKNELVPSIVQVSLNEIGLWIIVRVDNWTAEPAIIASNDFLLRRSDILER